MLPNQSPTIEEKVASFESLMKRADFLDENNGEGGWNNLDESRKRLYDKQFLKEYVRFCLNLTSFAKRFFPKNKFLVFHSMIFNY